MHNIYYLNNTAYSQKQLTEFVLNELQQANLLPWQQNLYRFIIDWFSEKATINIQTSGSTGTPKLISFYKQQMQQSAFRTLNYFNIKPQQTVLLCLPAQYIAGIMMVVRAFVGNLNLITISPSQINLNGLPTINFAAMVPLQIEQVIDNNQPHNLIEKLIIGGAALPFNIAQKVITQFKGKAWETYGMTETITHVAVREINNKYFENSFNALPNIKFKLNNKQCLVINDLLLLENEIETTDKVNLLSEIQFKFIGRTNNTINSGGIKIQPEEVEQIYSKFIIGNFCVTSQTHPKYGEVMVLVIEKNTDLTQFKLNIETFNKIYQPKQIIAIEKIPTLHNFKVDYVELRKILNLL